MKRIRAWWRLRRNWERIAGALRDELTELRGQQP